MGGEEEHSSVERLILKHAMRCFGRRGYAATTLRGIAAEVNVTAPLVSYYFKSKENLYSKVAEIVMGSLESEVAWLRSHGVSLVWSMRYNHNRK